MSGELDNTPHQRPPGQPRLLDCPWIGGQDVMSRWTGPLNAVALTWNETGGAISFGPFASTEQSSFDRVVDEAVNVPPCCPAGLAKVASRQEPMNWLIGRALVTPRRNHHPESVGGPQNMRLANQKFNASGAVPRQVDARDVDTPKMHTTSPSDQPRCLKRSGMSNWLNSRSGWSLSTPTPRRQRLSSSTCCRPGIMAGRFRIKSPKTMPPAAHYQ
jgi:hypothetical protein